MEKVYLILFEDSFEITKFNSITSTFYLKVKTLPFPNMNWSDITSSVLAMWLDTMIKFIHEDEKEITLYYMEGDYSIELHWISKDESVARFIEPCGNVVFHDKINLPFFCLQLFSATRKVINYYRVIDGIKAIKELSDLLNRFSTVVQQHDLVVNIEG